ncbi:MAG: hypothetical protein CMJ34_05075 [Phycisphaerae bacterium]|nr:hypothetical protein [Phycisphaerae bacterium]
MNPTPFRAAILGLALAITGVSHHAVAQTASMARLQLELDALDTMTDTLGPMRGNARKRVEMMQQFISESGRMDAWKSWNGEDKNSRFNSMTFQQAYQETLDKQKSRGTVKPSTDSQDTLNAEVKGQRTIAEDQWNAVNALHEQVARMTTFLQSQKAMDDYAAFAQKAANDPPQRPDAGTDQRSEQEGITPAQREANIKKYRAQQAALKQHWDHYHFTTGYSSVPPGGPFRGQPQGSPVGTPANEVRGDDPYLGAYPYGTGYGGDYWGGSWWNGYADPYYDVYGWPGRSFDAVRARRAYHRHENSAPHVRRR